MGHSFCTEKTGFDISEFLSSRDVAFRRGHGDMGRLIIYHVAITCTVPKTKNTWEFKVCLLLIG